MKKIIGGSILIALIAVGFYFAKGTNGEEQKFTTANVDRGDIRATVTATGTLNAVTTVLVGTQVSGTIKNIYVDFNSHVRKGQLLARIDPATFNQQVAQAKANVAAARANIEKAEADLLDKRRALERSKTLFERRLIARSDLDTAETNELTSAAQLKVVQAQLGQSTAALNVALTNLQYTDILSPIDGMVISRNVDVGQTVAASFQTPTLFTIAQDLSKMQINVSVDEADIGKIHAGQQVEFTVDAYPDDMLQGKVSVIRNAPITVQNVVTYDVVVLVDNPEMILKPGMTANVLIITAVRNNVLEVPNAALRYRPADKSLVGENTYSGKGPAVWTLAGNRQERVDVTIGISDGINTEITSGALKEGDSVILAASSAKKAEGSFFGRRGLH